MEARYAELIELEETREYALQAIEKNKDSIKKCFDKKKKARSFQEGDLVLK